jgi:hypothetical protein
MFVNVLQGQTGPDKEFKKVQQNFHMRTESLCKPVSEGRRGMAARKIPTF